MQGASLMARGPGYASHSLLVLWIDRVHSTAGCGPARDTECDPIGTNTGRTHG